MDFRFKAPKRFRPGIWGVGNYFLKLALWGGLPPLIWGKVGERRGLKLGNPPLLYS